MWNQSTSKFKRCLLDNILCFKGSFNIYILIRLCWELVEFIYIDEKKVSIPEETWLGYGILVDSKRGSI